MEDFTNFELYQSEIPVLGVYRMPLGLQSDYIETNSIVNLFILSNAETIDVYVLYPFKDTEHSKHIKSYHFVSKCMILYDFVCTFLVNIKHQLLMFYIN